MNQRQFERMASAPGFIAALDQSGGSTPKALANYGVKEDEYSSEEEMFERVHEMRTRIITSPSFCSEHILGAILFEKTMDSEIEGKPTASFLWEDKGIVPFLKVDKGLADKCCGVQLMKPMPELQTLLKKAKEKEIFGTKMRSVIHEYNEDGIQKVVSQQFEVAQTILEAGLVPIIEPEVDIHSKEKSKIEGFLKEQLLEHLDRLPADQQVMLKLTLPSEANLYRELCEHPKVLRVVALSGGYEREMANDLLSQNDQMIASFSRALSEGLRADQEQEAFDEMLKDSVRSIYEASVKQ